MTKPYMTFERRRSNTERRPSDTVTRKPTILYISTRISLIANQDPCRFYKLVLNRNRATFNDIFTMANLKAAGHEFRLPTEEEIEEAMRARSAAPSHRPADPPDPEA